MRLNLFASRFPPRPCAVPPLDGAGSPQLSAPATLRRCTLGTEDAPAHAARAESSAQVRGHIEDNSEYQVLPEVNQQPVAGASAGHRPVLQGPQDVDWPM